MAHPLDACIAVSRFGIRARPVELESASVNPMSWLSDQLDLKSRFALNLRVSRIRAMQSTERFKAVPFVKCRLRIYTTRAAEEFVRVLRGWPVKSTNDLP